MSSRNCYTLSPSRRCIPGWMACPLLGALMVFLLVHAARRARSYAELDVPRSAPAIALPALSIGDAGETLLADVYPTRQAAIRALALRLPEAIEQIAHDPATFAMTFEQDAATSPLFESLRKHFPKTKLASGDDKTPPAADRITIALKINEENSKSSHRKSIVLISSSSKERSTTLSTKISQCDWADDLAEYANAHPDHQWLIARSPVPYSSAEEARRAAEEVAANSLSALLPPIQSGIPAPTQDASEPRRAFWYDIRNSLPIADRFTQQFRRPYGNVWTHAILLEVSPRWLDEMRQRQFVVVHMREARVRNTTVSMVGVLLAILLAYCFANVLTKSYFTTRLRVIAIACALLVLVVAFGIITLS